MCDLIDGYAYNDQDKVIQTIQSMYLLIPKTKYAGGSGEQRTFSVEANKAYNKMIWNKVFVVVGMSFECETDRFFLNALNKVQDDLIIGESLWIVVNPDSGVLNQSCQRIENALPCASVIPIEKNLMNSCKVTYKISL